MNRRNFVVGLGTVATISGVASVTAASFAESIEAGADFRLVVDEELTVRLGSGVPEDEDTLETQAGWRNSSLFNEGFDDEFEDDDDGQIAYVEDRNSDPTNEEIQFELALLNDNGEDNDGYTQFLNIENEGLTDQEVGIRYVYGDSVDTQEFDGDLQNNTEEGDVDATTVNELFVFETTDGSEQLSPEGTEGEEEEPGQVTIEPGDNEIDLSINLTEDRAVELANAAGVDEGIFDDGGVDEDLDLIDEIQIGLIQGGDDEDA